MIDSNRLTSRIFPVYPVCRTEDDPNDPSRNYFAYRGQKPITQEKSSRQDGKGTLVDVFA